MTSPARRTNGNAQQDYTAEAEFSIDTLNPMVTAVRSSDLLITDADADEGTFQVTVTFNEAMDTATASTDADLRPGGCRHVDPDRRQLWMSRQHDLHGDL